MTRSSLIRAIRITLAPDEGTDQMAKSSSRNGARVLWVTVHTAEGIRKASDLKAYFERADIQASSHAVADNTTLLDNLVPYDRAAWTLRNGNARSDNLELCGFASWSRAQWLDSNQGMINNAASWIRSRCLARGIPLVKLTPADVRAGRAGVIGHVDYTNGTGDGSHWDPGPGFPWDVVIARASSASGGGSSPSTTPAPPVTQTSEVELMERKTIGSSASTTSVRLLLPGGPNARIIVRPRLDAAGNSVNPVWLGHIYAWGDDKAGVGGDPYTGAPGTIKLTAHKTYKFPNAVWCDLEYSSVDPFEVDIVG